MVSDMDRFEYAHREYVDPDELTELGAEGWEYIGNLPLMLPDPDEEDEDVESVREVPVFKRRVR